MFTWLLEKVTGRHNGYHHGNRLPTDEEREEAIQITREGFADLAREAKWSEDHIADAVDQCLLSSWPIELGGKTYLVVNHFTPVPTPK